MQRECTEGISHYIRVAGILSLLLLPSCILSSGMTSYLPPEDPVLSRLKNSPAPLWKAPLKAAEVKDAFVLDQDGLLVVTMKVTGFMQVWGLQDHEVVLIDRNSGAVLWRIAVEELGRSVRDAAATADRVIVASIRDNPYAKKLTAFDRATGKQVWTMGTFPSDPHVLDPRNGLLYLASRSKEGFDVAAYRFADGAVRWKQSIRTDRKLEHFSLLFSEQGLVAGGERIVLLDPAQGTVKWSQPVAAELLPIAKIMHAGPALLVQGGGSLGSISTDRGTLAWKHAVPDRLLMDLQAAEGSIFLLEQDKAGAQTALRIDAASGKTVWSTAFREKLWSRFGLAKNNVYGTTRTSLLAVDAGTGRILQQVDLPGFMQGELAMPDAIAVQEGTVVVARETGVAGFRPGDLQFIYAQALPGDDVFAYAYAAQRLILRSNARGSSGKAAEMKGYVETTGLLRDQLVTQSTGKPAELTGHVGYGGGFEAAAQMANVAVNMAAAGVAFREVAVGENMKINEMQVDASRQCQERSIQAGYYLRPFYRDGWGVMIVRLADGARADLMVSQPNEPLRINSANLPLFLVDGKTNRLLVNGIGIAPDPLDSYDKVGFPKDVYDTWPGVPPTWTVPNASVFAHDIGKLSFTPYRAGGLPPAPAPLKESDRKLREAIMRSDAKTVEQLLAAGADPNVVDAIGFNAMFYAGILDNKNIVELLVEKGADATLRDRSGLLAYHYTFLTHGANASTGVIREAYLQQSKK
jgi:outer membrane protein assembly factor BamB